MIEFGEYLPDQPIHENPGATVANNVYSAATSYLPLPSLSVTTDAVNSRVLGGVFVYDQTGNTEGYAGTATKLYEVGTTHTDVSKAGDYSTASEESWFFAKWGNQVVAVNFTNPTQEITIGGANFADLANAPKAKYIAVVRDQLILGYTNDSTDGIRNNRLWFSAFNDITGWTAGTNQSDFQDLQGNGGDITQVVGGEYGVVFQSKKIWRMDYVGTPNIYAFREVEPEKGTTVPRSVVQYGRSIFYLGADGFYELVDGSYSKPIGHEKVNRTFLADFDTTYKHCVSAGIDPVKNLVVWAYPGQGNTNGLPNKLIIYNWVTGKWSTSDAVIEYLFNGISLGFTLEQLDTFGTLETLPYSLDSAAWKGGNLLLGGYDSAHKFGYLNGTALDATIETTEHGGNDYTFIEGVRPYIEGSGTVTISIGTRDNLSDTPTYSTATSVNSVGIAPIVKTARYMRHRASITGGFNHAKGIDLYQGAGDQI